MSRLKGLDQVFSNMNRLAENMTARTATGMEAFGARMENQGKSNAPWTDRTGNARRSINASTDVTVQKVQTFLAIGVEYGKYLELAHGGKYAIIWSTVTANRQEFITVLKQGFTL